MWKWAGLVAIWAKAIMGQFIIIWHQTQWWMLVLSHDHEYRGGKGYYNNIWSKSMDCYPAERDQQTRIAKSYIHHCSCQEFVFHMHATIAHALSLCRCNLHAYKYIIMIVRNPDTIHEVGVVYGHLCGCICSSICTAQADSRDMFSQDKKYSLHA